MKDVKNQIDRLNDICTNKGLMAIIFDFDYLEIKYKCVYFYNAQTILIAAEGHRVAWNFGVENNEIDMYLPYEVYKKLSSIYNRYDIKPSELCDKMLEKIMILKE